MSSEYEKKKVAGKAKSVHTLIMEQILGRPLEENEIVHHINGNKRDNRPENLQVMTRSEHAVLHNTGHVPSSETLQKIKEARKGKPAAHRKLSREQVLEIADRLTKGEGIRALARLFGINTRTIVCIRDGKTYRDWLSDYPDDAFPLNSGGKKNIRQMDKRKLGVKEVTDIRIRLLQNESVSSIARKYGVSNHAVMNIRDNVSYQDIPWPEEIMRLHRTDDMIVLAMLMLSLPLNPEKDEHTALVEDYLIAPDWRSVMMLRLVKRALAGDMEIAMVLMAMAGHGAEIDQAIAEESVFVQTMLKAMGIIEDQYS